jgi:hypothetical protein
MQYIVVDLINDEQLSIPIDNIEEAQNYADYLNHQIQDNLYCEVREYWG